MTSCKITSKQQNAVISTQMMYDMITKGDSGEYKVFKDLVVNLSQEIEKLKITLKVGKKEGNKAIQTMIEDRKRLLGQATLSYATDSYIYKIAFLDTLKNTYGDGYAKILGKKADVINLIDTIGKEGPMYITNTERSISNSAYKNIIYSAFDDIKYVDDNWTDLVTEISRTYKNRVVRDYLYVKEFGIDSFAKKMGTANVNESYKKLLKSIGDEDVNEYVLAASNINGLFNKELQGITKGLTKEEAIDKFNSLLDRTFGSSVDDEYMDYLRSELIFAENKSDITKGDTLMKYILYKQFNSGLYGVDDMKSFVESIGYKYEGVGYRIVDKEIPIGTKLTDVLSDFWSNMNLFDKMSKSEQKNMLYKIKSFILSNNEVDTVSGLYKTQIDFIVNTFDTMSDGLIKYDMKDIKKVALESTFMSKANKYNFINYGSSEEGINSLYGLIKSTSGGYKSGIEFVRKNKQLKQFLFGTADIDLISENMFNTVYNKNLYKILDMLGVSEGMLQKIFDGGKIEESLSKVISKESMSRFRESLDSYISDYVKVSTKGDSSVGIIAEARKYKSAEEFEKYLDNVEALDDVDEIIRIKKLDKQRYDYDAIKQDGDRYRDKYGKKDNFKKEHLDYAGREYSEGMNNIDIISVEAQKNYKGKLYISEILPTRGNRIKVVLSPIPQKKTIKQIREEANKVKYIEPITRDTIVKKLIEFRESFKNDIVEEARRFSYPAGKTNMGMILSSVGNGNIIAEGNVKYVFVKHNDFGEGMIGQEKKDIMNGVFNLNYINFPQKEIGYTIDNTIGVDLFDYSEVEKYVYNNVSEGNRVVIISDSFNNDVLNKLSLGDGIRKDVEQAMPMYGTIYRLEGGEFSIHTIDRPMLDAIKNKLSDVNGVVFSKEGESIEEIEKTNKAIDDRLVKIGINDTKQFKQEANRILNGDIVYNFKAFENLLDQVSSVTNGRFSKGYINIDNLKISISDFVNSADETVLYGLAEEFTIKLGIDIEGQVLSIGNKEKIKELLLGSLVGEDMAINRMAFLQELGIKVQPSEFNKVYDKNDILIRIGDKLYGESGLSIPRSFGMDGATYRYVYDNRDTIDNVIQKLYEGDIGAMNNLPESVKNFCYNMFTRNGEYLSDAQILGKPGNIETVEQKVAVVLGLIKKSLDEVVGDGFAYKIKGTEAPFSSIQIYDGNTIAKINGLDSTITDSLNVFKQKATDDVLDIVSGLFRGKKIDVKNGVSKSITTIKDDVFKTIDTYVDEIKKMNEGTFSEEEYMETQIKYKNILFNKMNNYFGKYGAAYGVNNIKKIMSDVMNFVQYTPEEGLLKGLEAKQIMVKELLDGIFGDLSKEVLDNSSDVNKLYSNINNSLFKKGSYNFAYNDKLYHITLDDMINYEMTRYVGGSTAIDNYKKLLSKVGTDGLDVEAKKNIYAMFFYANRLMDFDLVRAGGKVDVESFIDSVYKLDGDLYYSQKTIEGNIPVSDIIRRDVNISGLYVPKGVADDISSATLRASITELDEGSAHVIDRLIKRNTFIRISKGLKNGNVNITSIVKKAIDDVLENAINPDMLSKGALKVDLSDYAKQIEFQFNSLYGKIDGLGIFNIKDSGVARKLDKSLDIYRKQLQGYINSLVDIKYKGAALSDIVVNTSAGPRNLGAFVDSTKDNIDIEKITKSDLPSPTQYLDDVGGEGSVVEKQGFSVIDGQKVYDGVGAKNEIDRLTWDYCDFVL